MGIETIIMKLPQPNANHKAGDIKFGPDGYLYINFGDGACNEISMNFLVIFIFR